MLAAVVTREPDWNALPPRTPASVRRLLGRCLKKDPKARLQAIGDVRIEIEEIRTRGPEDEALALPATASSERISGRRWLWPAVAAGVVVIGGAAAFVWAPWRSATGAGQAVRFEVGESDKTKLFNGAAMAMSPDGHWMVFPATGEDGVRRYWLRSLDTVEARPLPGTESAFVPAAWSGDSKYVIFTTVASALKRVDIQGGPPQTLTGTHAVVRKPERRDFEQGRCRRLRVIPASAAVPSASVGRTSDSDDDSGEGRRRPQVGHNSFRTDATFSIFASQPIRIWRASTSVQSMPSRKSRASSGCSPRTGRRTAPGQGGAGSGHLLFLRDATLMAQPFDPVRMELGGEAVPIAEGVDSFEGQGYGLFSVSDTGALVYRGGAGAKLALTWLDQGGKPAGAFDAGEYANPAVSPDGTSIAVAIGPAGSRDIWTVDVGLKATKRLTFDPANDDNPVWSPDGKNIAFASNRTGEPKLYVKPADGSEEERLLTDQPGVPTSWSRKAASCCLPALLRKPATISGCYPIPDEPRAPRNRMRCSPPTSMRELPGSRPTADGSPTRHRNRTGQSCSSGRSCRIETRAHQGPNGWCRGGRRRQASLGGAPTAGSWCTWRTPNSWPWTSIRARDFRPGRRGGCSPCRRALGWDLAPDGKRFLFVAPPNGARAAPFEVVLNWATALKKE